MALRIIIIIALLLVGAIAIYFYAESLGSLVEKIINYYKDTGDKK